MSNPGSLRRGWRTGIFAACVSLLLVVSNLGTAAPLFAEGTPVVDTPDVETPAVETPDVETIEPTVPAPVESVEPVTAEPTDPVVTATTGATDAAPEEMPTTGVEAADAGTTSFAFDQASYTLPDGGSFTAVLTITVTGEVDARPLLIYSEQANTHSGGLGYTPGTVTGTGGVTCALSGSTAEYLGVSLSSVGSGSCVITSTWHRVDPDVVASQILAYEIADGQGLIRATAAIQFDATPSQTPTNAPTVAPTSTATQGTGTTSFSFDQSTYTLPTGGSFTAVLTITVTGALDERQINVFGLASDGGPSGIRASSSSTETTGDVSCAFHLDPSMGLPGTLSSTGSGTCTITATWFLEHPERDAVSLNAAEFLGQGSYRRANAAVVMGPASTATATEAPTETPTEVPTSTPTQAAGTTRYAFDQATYYLPGSGSFTSVLTITVSGAVTSRTVNHGAFISDGIPAGVSAQSAFATSSGGVSCSIGGTPSNYVTAYLSASASGTCVLTTTWHENDPSRKATLLDVVEIVGGRATSRGNAAIAVGPAPTSTPTQVAGTTSFAFDQETYHTMAGAPFQTVLTVTVDGVVGPRSIGFDTELIGGGGFQVDAGDSDTRATGDVTCEISLGSVVLQSTGSGTCVITTTWTVVEPLVGELRIIASEIIGEVKADRTSAIAVIELAPTSTATATSTQTNTPTATPTNTPSATPTNTPTATPTYTPTATPTYTPTTTATSTLTDPPTATAVPTDPPDTTSVPTKQAATTPSATATSQTIVTSLPSTGAGEDGSGNRMAGGWLALSAVVLLAATAAATRRKSRT